MHAAVCVFKIKHNFFFLWILQELEELNDLDLLQAFSQGTEHESCSEEFNQSTVNDSLQGAESDHWTDLSQTTDEVGITKGMGIGKERGEWDILPLSQAHSPSSMPRIWCIS